MAYALQNALLCYRPSVSPSVTWLDQSTRSQAVARI